MRTDHQPEHVVVAGDWHGDIPWSLSVVAKLPELLPGEYPRVLLHAGDFGVWTNDDSDAFLDQLNSSLGRSEGIIYFIDGNHEDHRYLHYLAGTPNPTAPVQLRDRIFWLPRGYRWTWHNRTWLALGGAVSLDQADRTSGIAWFPEEEITEAQGRRIMEDGPADVMLTHDAPARVPLRLDPTGDGWDRDALARSASHRERLQTVVDAVKPSYLIHGHYHLEHLSVTGMAYGPLTAVGLDKNNARSGNFRVLDVRAMVFQFPY
jgi:hypothetical protein